MGEAAKTLLLIDDDLILGAAVQDWLGGNGLAVLTARTGKEGLEFCAQRQVDVVLLDQKLPDGNGSGLCGEILKRNGDAKILFITAFPSFENAVQAIKAGAFDYLSKPFEPEELKLAVQRALNYQKLEEGCELARYRSTKEREESLLVGEGLKEVRRFLSLAASASETPVLITGETGTGKNQAAKAIHYQAEPQKGELVSVNCAALPETLIESELFGYEKGAFTGAQGSKKGLFEMAEGGTLLLDEIGEMPLRLQAKLLSVLEDKKVRRLGGEVERTVAVRVIAATNSLLEQALGRTFRRDLFYRLSVLRIHLPPLRERKEDIPVLAEHLLGRIPKGRAVRLSGAEIEKLKSYPWPGNVRELKNVLERAAILGVPPSGLLGRAGEESDCTATVVPGNGVLATLEEVEREHVRRALDKYYNNLARTSKALGISLSTLKRRIRAGWIK